jgi:hypothetical protein
MKPLLTLGWLVGFAVGGRGVVLPVAPAPREKPALKCEPLWTGESGAIIGGKMYTWDAPDSAEVTVTNISGAGVDIGSHSGPEAHLDLRVKDSTGADVKTEPYAKRLSTQSLFTPKPYIRKPGEVYRCGVGLLSTVPEGKRVAGTYKVRAVFTLRSKEYISNEIEVKQPGNKK